MTRAGDVPWPPAADPSEPPRVAVVGTGISGAACAAALLRAGLDVTAFDKSGHVGGRMATRRADVVRSDGTLQPIAFDHGCVPFAATDPGFVEAVERVIARGGAARWRQRVYAEFPAPRDRDVVVPTPDLPAFCRHLLSGVPLRLGRAVTGLQRSPEGWRLGFADDAVEGPFDQVVLALPPAQAAQLLAGHSDCGATSLAAVPMAPCWTLMAVTDDLDWPWDAAEPGRGELAWIGRGDRAPARVGAGLVPWVAHADARWSRDHLEDDPAQVREALCAALGRLIGAGSPPRWHRADVHRWRYARSPHGAPDETGRRYWLDPSRRLAACGDAFGGGVEAAWRSGDALAGALVASLGREASHDLSNPVRRRHGRATSRPPAPVHRPGEPDAHPPRRPPPTPPLATRLPNLSGAD